MVRLVYRDGSTNKFWEAKVEGSTFTVRFGKIGRWGRVMTKELASPEEARAELDKKAAEKRKKGYRDDRVDEPKQVVWPYDPPGGFPGAMGLVLGVLREGGYQNEQPTPAISALIVDDMPPDLKALLHTLSMKRPSMYLDLGVWDVGSRSLARGDEWSQFKDRCLSGTDLSRTVQIGSNPGGIPLLATWSPGSEHMDILELDHEYDSVQHFGSMASLIGAAAERLAESGEPMTADLEKLGYDNV